MSPFCLGGTCKGLVTRLDTHGAIANADGISLPELQVRLNDTKLFASWDGTTCASKPKLATEAEATCEVVALITFKAGSPDSTALAEMTRSACNLRETKTHAAH